MVEQLWNWENLSQNFWEKWFDWFAQQFIKVFSISLVTKPFLKSYQNIVNEFYKPFSERLYQIILVKFEVPFSDISSRSYLTVYCTILEHMFMHFSNSLSCNFRTVYPTIFEQFVWVPSPRLKWNAKLMRLKSFERRMQRDFK